MTLQIEAGTSDEYDQNNRKPMVLWRNRMQLGTITASSETADGAAENAIDDLTWDFWTPNALAATFAVVISSPAELDCAAIVAHTLGTNGNTVQVQYWDGAAWETVSTIVPDDDSPILAIWEPVESDEWRFRISGGTEPNIGVLMLGERLIFPTGILEGYVALHHAKRYDLMNSTSIGGQFLGNRVNRVGAETTVTFGMIERSWVDGAMRNFETHYNEGKPFYYAGSPSDMEKDHGYCWRPQGGGELRPAFIEGDYWAEMTMDLASYVE